MARGYSVSWLRITRSSTTLAPPVVINWLFFPKSDAAPDVVRDVVRVFEAVAAHVDSSQHEHSSDRVLGYLAPGLAAAGFEVESGKKEAEKVRVPVLFGRHGAMEKWFEADAWDRERRMVVEVEAGRGVVNNQFLKDLFQACMMHDVDYLGIAVRKVYRKSQDFERVVRFFETLYASQRLKLPLKGVLVIGY